MKNLVEIYYPIVRDYNFETYDFEQKYIIAKEISIVLSNSLKIEEKWIKNYSIKAEIVDYDPKVNTQNIPKSFFYGLKEQSLKFTIEVEVALSNLEVTYRQGNKITRITDEDKLLEHLPYSLFDTFGVCLFEVLVLSQIARPGSLKIREGIVFIDKNRLYNVLPQIHNMRESLELRNCKNYPSIDYLNFSEYYDWILRNDLLFPKISKNSYQKSLTNLTYVFSEESEISAFIFQMRILEQIFTENTFQISDQLNKKIQAYLGELESFKKQIKRMYSVRSKFLHGSSDVLPSHKSDHEINEHQKYRQEFYEASCFSLLLIISTLQKMYKENRLELNFKLIIE